MSTSVHKKPVHWRVQVSPYSHSFFISLSLKPRCTNPHRIKGLIADAAALSIAGQSTTPALLALIESFRDEDSYHVWSQVLSTLSNIRSIFAENEKVAVGLKHFVLKLVAPASQKVGWESKNKDFLEGQLRALLIAAAGDAGHEKYTHLQKQSKLNFD